MLNRARGMPNLLQFMHMAGSQVSLGHRPEPVAEQPGIMGASQRFNPNQGEHVITRANLLMTKIGQFQTFVLAADAADQGPTVDARQHGNRIALAPQHAFYTER